MNPKVDLESAIMKVWQTSDDIDLLFKHYGDAPHPMTEDEVLNALLGIKPESGLENRMLFSWCACLIEAPPYSRD